MATSDCPTISFKIVIVMFIMRNVKFQPQFALMNPAFIYVTVLEKVEWIGTCRWLPNSNDSKSKAPKERGLDDRTIDRSTHPRKTTA